VAKSVHSYCAVGWNQGLANELRQFATCLSPHEIHLEEAILSMNKARGTGQVLSGLAP
jgi:hypothetical protein